MTDKLFANIMLPVYPDAPVDGATIHFAEVVEDEAVLGEPFFGGYADDFLADLGFDLMETAPEETAIKAKRIQG